MRDRQTQLRSLLADTLPFQPAGFSSSLLNGPMLPRNPLERADYFMNPLPFQTNFDNELSMLATPNYLLQQSMETQLLTELLELERRAIHSFEILLESGLLEDHREQGLNREQINNIEVSEFQEQPAEKGPVPRIKTRNGIHKKAKEDPKKTIKEVIQKQKQEPTSSRTCAICLEDYKDKEKLRKLPCSHKFHKDCIDTWLSLKNNCPVCKGKPVEEPQQSPSTNGAASSLFNNSDILQLFRPQGSLPTPTPNISTPTSASRLSGLISNSQSFNQMQGPSAITINSNNSNNANAVQSLNRQTRRAAGNRRAEANNRKKF